MQCIPTWYFWNLQRMRKHTEFWGHNSCQKERKLEQTGWKQGCQCHIVTQNRFYYLFFDCDPSKIIYQYLLNTPAHRSVNSYKAQLASASVIVPQQNGQYCAPQNTHKSMWHYNIFCNRSSNETSLDGCLIFGESKFHRNRQMSF